MWNQKTTTLIFTVVKISNLEFLYITSSVYANVLKHFKFWININLTKCYRLYLKLWKSFRTFNHLKSSTFFLAVHFLSVWFSWLIYPSGTRCIEGDGVVMNQCYPKHKQWARDTKSYPCRLYGKSGERERETEKVCYWRRKNENKKQERKTEDADSSTEQFYEELDKFSSLNFLH